MSFDWTARFISTTAVNRQFDLNNNTIMRWRRVTGIDPRPVEQRSSGNRAPMTGREVHQLLTFLDVTDPNRSGQGGHKVAIDSVRWIWQPAMLALEFHYGGWVVTDPGMAWTWYPNPRMAAEHLAKLPFGALVDLTPPYALVAWLDSQRGT